MLWINEVKMVDSGDDLKSSRSIKGTHGPDFEVLDARIASALKKVIQNTRFKKKVSLEEMKAQKVRRRQIAYLIYEYFRVIGANDSVENYADLFTLVLRNDDIQEFDSKWDGILLSMTKIPHDDILEGFVQIKNTRVWETQDRFGIVQYGDSPEEAEPDYHRLKTMLKEVSCIVWDWRTLKPEMKNLKQAPWSRIKG